MPIFSIATDSDDGATYYRGQSLSSSSSGTIGLSAICLGTGRLYVAWTPVSGQKSCTYVVKNNGGTTVYSSGCSEISPTADNQVTTNNILANRTDGPFTVEMTIYDGVSCSGSIIGTGTAGGFNRIDSNCFEGTGSFGIVGDLSYALGEPLSYYDLESHMRFQNVTIPQGVLVVSAQIRVQAVNKSGAHQAIRIFAQNSDNVTSVPSGTSSTPGTGPKTDFDGRPKTSSFYEVTLNPWVPSNIYIFPITNLIQEVIDRPGWSSGNNLMLLWTLQDEVAEFISPGNHVDWQDYPSLNAAQLTIEFGEPSIGVAAGTSTVNGISQSGNRGDADGQSDAIAFSAFDQELVGSASGVGAASGVGISNAEAAGTAAGVGDANGVIEWLSVGISSGIGTASGVAIVLSSSVGSASGVGVASGVGISNAEAAGTAAGVGDANGVIESTKEAAGAATGVGDADGAEGLQGFDSVGTAPSVGGVAGVGLSENPTIGTTAGTSDAAAIREVLVESVGIAGGTSIVLGVGASLARTTGSAAGTSLIEGRKLSDTRIFLSDLTDRLGRRSVGGDSTRFLELDGASIIEPTAFEPDPSTHRRSHYYHAVTNTLYRKVTTHSEPGIVVAHWQKVSD